MYLATLFVLLILCALSAYFSIKYYHMCKNSEDSLSNMNDMNAVQTSANCAIICGVFIFGSIVYQLLL